MTFEDFCITYIDTGAIHPKDIDQIAYRIHQVVTDLDPEMKDHIEEYLRARKKLANTLFKKGIY